MARYGMRDQRTARRFMHEAGAFKVANRLVVRTDDLESHERRLATPRDTSVAGTGPRRAVGRCQQAEVSPASGPDWWRPDSEPRRP